MENTPASNLYNLLVTRDFEPEIKDHAGDDVTDPSKAEIFAFDWKTPTRNYGTVVILLDDENNLTVYFGDNLGRTMDSEDKTEWYTFLHQMKEFAVRNKFKNFSTNNISKLKFARQGMAALKEGLFESYFGNKNYSYSGAPRMTRLVIKHNKPLDEDDARFRYIENLFIETDQGERFKLPFTKLVGGRAMLEHVKAGGTPYDPFGQHIVQMVVEMNTLARFIRAAKHKNFTGTTADLVETAVRHYRDLKAKAKRMVSKRGYMQEFEAFDPTAITEVEHTVDSIKNLFIEQSLDHRIEEALPILARLQQESSHMPELKEFESWMNQVTEGTWSVPDTPKQVDALKQIMSKEFPVGVDALDSTQQLYDVLGDDTLFERLYDLSQMDAEADARPVILTRLRELGIEIPDIVDKQDMEEDLDTDGVMMTKPSNMSSESNELLALKRLL